MKVISQICLLAIGFLSLVAADDTSAEVDKSVKINVTQNIETTKSIAVNTKLDDKNKVAAELVLPSSTIYPSTADPDSSLKEKLADATNSTIVDDDKSDEKTQETDVDEDESNDEESDDNNAVDDDEAKSLLSNDTAILDSLSNNSSDVDLIDFITNSSTTEMAENPTPLALSGDNSTADTPPTTVSIITYIPRPPSFTAGSFFIGLVLGLVIIAAVYYAYVVYQRRKTQSSAGYRSYP